jgi:hypothetical protein
MERFMYQDDSFERMLKQKADEYRMYPSDKSWDFIQRKMKDSGRHSNWKIVSVLIVIFSSLGLYTSTHQDRSFKNLQTNKELTEDNIINRNQPITVKSYFKPAKNTSVLRIVSKDEYPAEDDAVVGNNETAVILPFTQVPVQHEVEFAQPKELQNDLSSERSTELTIIKAKQEYRLTAFNPAPVVSFDRAPIIEENVLAKNNELPASSIEDESDLKEPEIIPANQTDADLNFEVKVPFAKPAPPKKLLQFYITPSISYRVLIAENQFTFGNFQNNPNNAVNHRSSLGWEACAALLLRSSKRFTFKTGIQLNYTRYIVRASKFSPELTSVPMVSSNSLLRETTLRNNNGFFAQDIPNKTMQISIPVGFEYTIARNSNVSFNLSGTVQPSYLLNATGYLITGDYKNYIKAPDLLSRMNLNTGFEIFARWNAGPFEMQAGPQVRYQLFSNSLERYPIQEHLVDYGFKIGFIKPLR